MMVEMAARRLATLVLVTAAMVGVPGCSDEMFDAECDLIVVNESLCPVTVYVDGQPAFTVESGSDRILDDIGPGQHIIEAMDPNGAMLERRTVELASSEDYYLIVDDC